MILTYFENENKLHRRHPDSDSQVSELPPRLIKKFQLSFGTVTRDNIEKQTVLRKEPELRVKKIR